MVILFLSGMMYVLGGTHLAVTHSTISIDEPITLVRITSEFVATYRHDPAAMPKSVVRDIPLLHRRAKVPNSSTKTLRLDISDTWGYLKWKPPKYGCPSPGDRWLRSGPPDNIPPEAIINQVRYIWYRPS